MNEPLFGHWAKMDEAGDAGGEGGGGGAGGDAGNLSAAGTDGAGDGDAGDGGDAGGEGALAGAGKAGVDADGKIDWDKITSEEYFGKVTAPTIDGVDVNMDATMKNYGDFCRKHHIAPEVVTEFLKMEGDRFAKGMAADRATRAEEAKALKANFDAQGEALHKAYSNEQIGTAVKVLANNFAGDKDFMKVATTLMANNSTLVKLLLNYGEHHGVDNNAGAGNGAGGESAKGFAARWTGRNI